MIVHDSLYNYFFVDLRRLGVPHGACFFLTFLVSAVALGFFYPVLLVMFLGFGVAFVYLTQALGTTGRWWNIFFWSATTHHSDAHTATHTSLELTHPSSLMLQCRANLIIGNGMLLIMYSLEYFARQPALPGSAAFAYDPTSWWPLSWQPFIKA